MSVCLHCVNDPRTQPRVCLVLVEPKREWEGMHLLEPVTASLELPVQCWELNPGLPKEQQVLSLLSSSWALSIKALIFLRFCLVTAIFFVFLAYLFPKTASAWYLLFMYVHVCYHLSFHILVGISPLFLYLVNIP